MDLSTPIPSGDMEYQMDMSASLRTDEMDYQMDLSTPISNQQQRDSDMVYYCQECPEPTAGLRAKPWPRLDNFKAHIKRKHPKVDLDQLIQA